MEESSQNPSSPRNDLNKSSSSTTSGAAVIEENIEDRYNKLKVMAVKLKRKVTEQAEEIEKIKGEKCKLAERSNTASKIQQEYDKALDEIEKLKKNESMLQKDLKSAVDETVKLKEWRTDETAQIQSISASHKNLRERCDRLEKSSEENSQWKSKAEEYLKQLEELSSLQKDALQEKRQTNLLSLEITDYEKKLHDSHTSLEDKIREIERTKSELNEKDSLIINLKEKLESSENTVSNLAETKESLIKELADVKIKTSERISLLQAELNKVNEEFKEKKKDFLVLQSEFENKKLIFADESKNLMDKNTSLQKTILMLEHKLSVLEENKRSRESQISNLNLELKQLESEYNNYKIKAKTMLKSQKPSIGRTQETDELENMQKIIQDFHAEISILKSDIQTLKMENENLTVEKTELNQKLNQSKTNLIEKETQMSTELQDLRVQIRQKNSEIQSERENAKIDQVALNSSHQAQLTQFKLNYESQLADLRDKYEKLKLLLSESNDSRARAHALNFNQNQNCNDQQQQVQEFQSINNDWKLSPGGNISSSSSNPLTIDIPNNNGMTALEALRIPRGECEGSDSNSNTHILHHRDSYSRDSLTFEQLLNSSDIDSSPKNYEEDLEVHRKVAMNLREELFKAQSQNKHLTSLLRDSEANCDRLNQLSEALKEEIRRIERDLERKEHLKENTEYFKNVLLKFVTLDGDVEKLRLIPVFKTMLRLTPDECNKLEVSVKGTNQQNQGRTSWSSYIWSSGDT